MHLNIQINTKEDAAAGRRLFEELAIERNHEATLTGIGILESGMESGNTSCMIQIKAHDGTNHFVQISAAMFLAAAGAVRGACERFGDPVL